MMTLQTFWELLDRVSFLMFNGCETPPLITLWHVGRTLSLSLTSQSTDTNNSSLIGVLNLPRFLIFLIIHLFSD